MAYGESGQPEHDPPDLPLGVQPAPYYQNPHPPGAYRPPAQYQPPGVGADPAYPGSWRRPEWPQPQPEWPQHGWPPPGRPQPQWPGAEWPPPAPPPRRLRGLLIALSVVVALLICATPLAVLVRLGADGTPVAGGLGSGSGRGGTRGGGVEGAIADRLAAQSAALIKGDQAAYLDAAEPTATKLRDELRLRYGSLRALKVAEFTQSVADLHSLDTGQSRWQADINVAVCFVAANCSAQRIQVSTRWNATGGQVRMTDLDDSGRDSNGPRPWEMSNLAARGGTRTLVATSRSFSNRLPKLQTLAERAAAVADRFSIGAKPDRYIIFFGTSREVESWYGGDVPKWSIGYALPSGPSTLDVAVRLDDIDIDFVDDVLRHELTHVATLSGGDTTTAGFFWLVEGIAEYAMETGRPVSSYPDLEAVRRYLRDKRWDGKLEHIEPTADTPDSQVAAFYGIGYLASRRLGDRYGRAKLLEFFRLAIHDGQKVDAASRTAFGAAWSTVSADCVKFVRRSAG